LKTNKNHECTWAFILSLIIVMFMLITPLFSNFESVLLSSNDLTDFGSGWVVNGEKVDLPYMSDAKKNEPITLSNTLPQHFPDQSNLFFFSSYKDIQIYVENQLIYSYGVNNYYLFSDNPGNSYQIIQLPKSLEGKSLTIIITPKTYSNSGHIPKIYIGTTGSIFHKIIVSSSFEVITSSLILILSLFYIFQSLLLIKKVKSVKGLLYLGVSGVLFAGYNSINSMLWQFFEGNSLLMYFALYYFLMLLPIALILCVKNLFNVFNFKIFNFLILVSLANIVINSILEVTGILSLADSAVITHTINILAILSIYFMFIKYKKDYDMTLQHGLLLYTTTVLIDIIRRLFDPDSRSFFSIIGIIIFILFVGKKTLDKMTFEISEGKKYKDIAYHDTLTGAYTLMALNENIHKLEKTADYGVAVFDLNSLKYYNDKFGHSVGDYMLTTAANVLSQSFENSKYVYRIGGDEFLIIMPNADLTDFETSINKLEFLQIQASSLHFVNGESIIIEFAYGFALHEEDETFDSVRKKADANMYSKKNEQKK